MKNIFIIACVFLSQILCAQKAIDKTPPETIQDENPIYNLAGIQVKPEFPGGTSAFMQFVSANFKTPDEKGLSGKIYVTFVIEKDGSLSDIKVLRDIGFGTAEEAIRVISSSPRWLPGEHEGYKVRTRYTLPITIANK
ncbi:MAG TPA: energy transducer TonB [Flavobacterium sp.]|jgi:protein TonB